MSNFALVADDAQTPPVIHIIIWRDPDETWSWNVACCGESLDDYALVSFENTEAGLSMEWVCARCFEAFGSDLASGRIV